MFWTNTTWFHPVNSGNDCSKSLERANEEAKACFCLVHHGTIHQEDAANVGFRVL